MCYNSLLINDRYSTLRHAVYSTVIKLYFMYITWRSIESVTGFTLLDTLSNFGCVCSEISRTYCRKNIINRKFLKRCWKYEISPIVQANYRSKRIDFSLENSQRQRTKFAHFTCITFAQYCSLYATYYCACPFLVKICSLTFRYIENQDQENTDDYRCLSAAIV